MSFPFAALWSNARVSISIGALLALIGLGAVGSRYVDKINAAEPRLDRHAAQLDALERRDIRFEGQLQRIEDGIVRIERRLGR